MAEPVGEGVAVPDVQDMPKVYVEWDEPGAGGICIDGKRLIDFSVETDWSEAWEPKVDPVALAFLDRLPRWAQEVTHAYWCAKRSEERAALSAREVPTDG